jgi:hypothetical protein
MDQNRGPHSSGWVLSVGKASRLENTAGQGREVQTLLAPELSNRAGLVAVYVPGAAFNSLHSGKA